MINYQNVSLGNIWFFLPKMKSCLPTYRFKQGGATFVFGRQGHGGGGGAWPLKIYVILFAPLIKCSKKLKKKC